MSEISVQFGSATKKISHTLQEASIVWKEAKMEWCGEWKALGDSQMKNTKQ